MNRFTSIVMSGIVCLVVAGCSGTETAETPVTPSVTATTRAVTTTVAQTTSTTAVPATTATPTTTITPTTTAPTTTTLGPQSQEDFDALYRQLEAVRVSAGKAGDPELWLEATTAANLGYQDFAELIAAGGSYVYAADHDDRYTIDDVVLYDRPADDRALLLVTDTFDGRISIVDANGDEIDAVDREGAPTQPFLVTLIDTDDGWRIDADLGVADDDTPPGSLLFVEKPTDDAVVTRVEERDGEAPGARMQYWRSENGEWCLRVAVNRPRLGRIVHCVPENGQPGTFDFYTVPLRDTDGTIYTTYFVLSPGGEIGSIEFSTIGGTGTYVSPPTVALGGGTDLNAVWGVVPAETTEFTLFDHNGGVLFRSEVD